MELRLKFNFLQPDAITEKTITTILSNGAIDHTLNNGIYVTGYAFNFWVDVDQKRKLLVLYTYWETKPDRDELEILRFVNQANTHKIMLQFSYNEELGRFYAYYAHPYNVGLIPPHVLKLTHKFAAIFEGVVHEGIADGVLHDLPTCPDDDDDTATTDSTVH